MQRVDKLITVFALLLLLILLFMMINNRYIKTDKTKPASAQKMIETAGQKTKQ